MSRSQPEASLKEKIVATAAEILIQDGVKKLTQPEVARRAGLRQSHLTYYFPRKLDLVTALFDHFLAHAAERLGTAEDGRDRAATILGLHSLVTDPARMRVFVGLLIEAEDYPELQAMLSDHLAQFRRLVAQRFGRPPDDPGVGQLLDLLRGIGLRHLLSTESDAWTVSDVERLVSRMLPEDEGGTNGSE